MVTRTGISSADEDPRALRLASELADLRAGDANPYKTQAFWCVRKRADHQQKAAPKTQSVFLTEFFTEAKKKRKRGGKS